MDGQVSKEDNLSNFILLTKNLDGDKVFRAAVFEDFSSIPDGGIKKLFRTDVEECWNWNGNFASRKRRSIEEELGEAAEESFAMLPLIRQRRQAVRKAAGKKGIAKKAKKGPAKKSVKKVARKSPAKSKKGGKSKGKGKKGPKKGGKGASGGQRSSDKGVYNSLWCVDLAVQKYLQTCVKNALTRGESWDI